MAIGDTKTLGKVGVETIVFYLLTASLAVCIALGTGIQQLNRHLVKVSLFNRRKIRGVREFAHLRMAGHGLGKVVFIQ